MLDDYLRQYALVAIFLGISTFIPMSMLLISKAGHYFRIRPSRPTNVKRTAYEGGMRPFGPPPTRFNVRYYYYALLFVIFDVETILLYPWAVQYSILSQEFGARALVAGLVFLFVVTLGFVYAWRKRILEWRYDHNKN